MERAARTARVCSSASLAARSFFAASFFYSAMAASSIALFLRRRRLASVSAVVYDRSKTANGTGSFAAARNARSAVAGLALRSCRKAFPSVSGARIRFEDGGVFGRRRHPPAPSGRIFHPGGAWTGGRGEAEMGRRRSYRSGARWRSR